MHAHCKIVDAGVRTFDGESMRFPRKAFCVGHRKMHIDNPERQINPTSVGEGAQAEKCAAEDRSAAQRCRMSAWTPVYNSSIIYDYSIVQFAYMSAKTQNRT